MFLEKKYGIYESLAENLTTVLKNHGISDQLIEQTINSGYYMTTPLGDTVRDMMYGNKMSGHLYLNKFIEYLKGNNNFPKLFSSNRFAVEFTVKNIDEINDVIFDKTRQRYIQEGRMSFRGQTSQYYYQRAIPHPQRSDENGKEISIFPGAYRQSNDIYTFKDKCLENRSFMRFLSELEPNNPHLYFESSSSYDIMRIEQHYATQTAGLDISFDIETAIFFATHKFKFNSSNKAFHEKVKVGDHSGVIYGFVFGSPSVKKSEFLIHEFDLFKTYQPERVLRQACGLPLFGDHERNIAVTDLDFIIYLHKDFDYQSIKTPEFMFPNTKEDSFYGKLLEIKDRHPDELSAIVEYEGSRV